MAAVRRHDPFPLTSAQVAHLGGRRYVEADVVGLDLGRYAAAWRHVIDRHDALRTVAANGLQRVLPDVPEHEVAVTDLRARSHEERERRLGDIRREMLARTLAPGGWPPFEVRAALLDERRTRLCIAIEEVVADDDSAGILANDVRRWYEDGACGDAPIPALRDVLARLEPGHQRPSGPASARCRTIRRRRRVDAEQWDRLRWRARRAGVTPASTLACLFADALGAWSRAPRFTLAVATSCRPLGDPSVARMVGDFTRLVPLVAAAGPGRSFRERAGALHLRPVVGREDPASCAVVFTPRLTCEAAHRCAWALGRGELVFENRQTPGVWLAHEAAEDQGELVLTWDHAEAAFPARTLDVVIAAHLRLIADLADGDARWERAR